MILDSKFSLGCHFFRFRPTWLKLYMRKDECLNNFRLYHGPNRIYGRFAWATARNGCRMTKSQFCLGCHWLLRRFAADNSEYLFLVRTNILIYSASQRNLNEYPNIFGKPTKLEQISEYIANIKHLNEYLNMSQFWP